MSDPTGTIQTFTGKRFCYKDPTPESIDITDIAVALSRECRYAGHILLYYSVAQHCVHVSEVVSLTSTPETASEVGAVLMQRGFKDNELRYQLVQDCLAFLGLMHDATEAYMKDIPSPLKAILPDYKALEEKAERAVFARFGLLELYENPNIWETVKRADYGMYLTEVRTLWPNRHIDGHGVPFDVKIHPWDPNEACVRFLARFNELKGRLQGVCAS